MNKKATYTDKMKSRIKELVDENRPLFGLRKTLKEEGTCAYDRSTINDYIRDELTKKWDKTIKRWVDTNTIPQPLSKDVIPPNKMSIGENQKLIAEAYVPITEPNKEYNKPVKKVSNPETGSPAQSKGNQDHSEHPLPTNSSPPPSDDIKLILETCSLIRNEIKKLYSSIESLENNVDSLKEDLNTSKQKNVEKFDLLAKDFINIYTSEKSKKSIYINSEIRNRITKKMEAMEEPYKVVKNDSLAINVALLIALFK